MAVSVVNEMRGMLRLENIRTSVYRRIERGFDFLVSFSRQD